ncbi:YncE family protein [Vagococcus vulneris]|uniref:Lipoprotein n=1 Tax=Vagococcus vulneris TaxID=1977869 RepID=A0A430A1Y8_9ENTE|nr:hypothetical protein [Vagococcus vulneris]RSU00435.1 hypothetical protein CBF37_00015 [Vagococcus vulneris]
MKKKQIYKWFIVFLFSTFLTACVNLEKTQKADTTDSKPAVYHKIDNQGRVLKEFPQFYQASYFGNNKINRDRGTYVVPGLIATESLSLNNSNHLSESYQMDPQGVTVVENYLVISAYSHDERHASVLYVLDRLTHNYIKTIVLEGNPHVGGIAYDDQSKNLWVCAKTDTSEAAIVSIPLVRIRDYQIDINKAPIKYDQVVVLDDIKRASFIAYKNGSLFVGYFSINHEGILDEYALNKHGNLKRTVKNRVVLTTKTDQLSAETTFKVEHGIQGITFYKDFVLLSQSYGPEDSAILVYRHKQGREKVRYLDEEVLMKIEAPPYLEQISVKDNILYTIFESGTQRFRTNPSVTVVDRIIELDLPILLKDLDK